MGSIPWYTELKFLATIREGTIAIDPLPIDTGDMAACFTGLPAKFLFTKYHQALTIDHQDRPQLSYFI